MTQKSPDTRQALDHHVSEDRMDMGIESDGVESYDPVPVFTTLNVGVGFRVIRFTDSRLLSSAMFA